MLQLLIFIFIAGSVTLIAQVLIPFFAERYKNVHERKAEQASESLDEMFVWIAQKKLILIFGLSPVVLSVVAFLMTGKSIAILIGFISGFILPSLAIKIIDSQRRKKFQTQLIDALTNLSQSLKAGLSFFQALEILTEEMSPPISQEFGLVLKEAKVGKSLEESFENLNKKMGSEDLNLMTTAILVARETGGSLPDVFESLAHNIRQKNRIAEQIKTLTTQARWQGIIMSILPVGFAAMVYKMDPTYFDLMLQTDMGRLLLIWCAISWVIGVYILRGLSKIEV